ncbi:hypothetical protein ACWIUA_00490 [Ursidibacter sp. B-7004-1]
MISAFIRDGFAKSMVFCVAVLFAISSYLCVQNKAKQAQLNITQNLVKQQQEINKVLNLQLEKNNKQIEQYIKESQQLKQKVINHFQQKQERNNEIYQQLEQHKTWAEQPVPSSVGRLFKQPYYANGNAHTMPDGKPMPNANATDSAK